MKHLFDVEIAEEIGVNAAIILENINYWIEENRANERNFYEDTYWTFNTRKAFQEMFPYMSKRQINIAFEKLTELELIKTGNFNEKAYDRTLWYALTEKGEEMLNLSHCPKTENALSQNGKCNVSKTENALSQNGKCIYSTNINTNINTNIKEKYKKESKKESYDEIISSIEDEGLKELYLEYIKMRKLIKAPMTDRALKMLINRVNELEPDSITNKKKLLETAILNNWKSVYPLRGNKNEASTNVKRTYDKYADLE